MPRQSLEEALLRAIGTKEELEKELEWAEALQKWWDTFPYGGTSQRLEAIDKFEQQYGPLPEEWKDKALSDWPPELKEHFGTSKELTARTDIGEQEALKLCGSPLDDSHYDLLLDETGLIEKPNLETLCVLLRNRIPRDLRDAVRPIVRKAATHRKVAGGNRGAAAGTGMVRRRKRNGQLSNIMGAPNLEDLSDEDFTRIRSATDGVVGFLSRDIRPGGQPYPCRLTRYDGALPQELNLMSELARTVGETFKTSWMMDRWDAQFEKAKQTQPTWLIRTNEGITPFTTITCNRSFRTAAHVDQGDLKEGFGVMCCFGDFGGCDLVFPRYRAAVRYREGDVLLANVHEVHGNTPLLNPDGTVPRDHEPERLVCVFYYNVGMDKCESTMAKERKIINRRERGQTKPKAKAKAKAKAAGKK